MESGFGSDFGSDFGSGGGGGGKLDPGLIMEQVKVQIAVANAQELLQVRRGRDGGWGVGCPAARGSPALLPPLSSAGTGGRDSGGGCRPGPARRLSPAGARGPPHALSPQRMTDKCFRKCIGKPGGALDNSEQVSEAGETRGPAGHPPPHPRGDR